MTVGPNQARSEPITEALSVAEIQLALHELRTRKAGQLPPRPFVVPAPPIGPRGSALAPAPAPATAPQDGARPPAADLRAELLQPPVGSRNASDRLDQLRRRRHADVERLRAETTRGDAGIRRVDPQAAPRSDTAAESERETTGGGTTGASRGATGAVRSAVETTQGDIGTRPPDGQHGSPGAPVSRRVQGTGDLSAAELPDVIPYGRIPAGWVLLIGADSDASAALVAAAVVAVAVGDVAARLGRRVHVIETADPDLSVLQSADGVELGLDTSETWRRVDRGGVTLHRRANDAPPAGWPGSTAEGADLTLVDLGAADLADLHRVCTCDCRVVVATSSSRSALQRTEQVLAALTGRHVIVAVLRLRRSIRRPRFPALLRSLEAIDQTVPVPIERELLDGPIGGPLPASILDAAASLLRLVDGKPTGKPVARHRRDAWRQPEPPAWTAGFDR
jgi:hypothetical protein